MAVFQGTVDELHGWAHRHSKPGPADDEGLGWGRRFKVFELRLGDALDQGVLVYPVESITAEPVWYVTIPQGCIRVRILGDAD